MTKKFKGLGRGAVKCGLSLVFLLLSLALAPVAFDNLTLNQAGAAGWWDKANEGGLDVVGGAYGQSGAESENNDIRVIVARIIRVILELLGLIFLVLIIAAGFRWMMAGGDEAKVEEAKKQMVNSVIGLIIILAAWAIATYVFYQLQYSLTGVMPINWSW